MERESCPICGGPPTMDGAKAGHKRPKRYQLARCDRCGGGWVVNADDDYDAIYDASYYVGEGADPLVNYVLELEDRRTVRRYEWEGLLKIATDLGAPPAGRWIDFGGGAGGFARFLNDAGIDAYAYDTGYGIEIARQHGAPVASETLMQEWNGTVDVVSAIEVLEHVADPYPILDRIAQLLRPGGILLLTTGNVACHRGPLERWSYVMPEVHITFYSPSSLDVAYRKVGLLPIAARRSTGWDGVIRYKVLKNLGIHRRGLLEQLLPWAPIGWFLDRRRGVSAMLSARKAP